MLHLAADRALVDVEVLDHRRGPHRAVLGDVAEHQVGRRLQRLVHATGPLADHAPHPADQDADLLLELAQGLVAAHRPTSGSTVSSVVRSGTSSMNSTATSASTANGSATRNR